MRLMLTALIVLFVAPWSSAQQHVECVRCAPVNYMVAWDGGVFLLYGQACGNGWEDADIRDCTTTCEPTVYHGTPAMRCSCSTSPRTGCIWNTIVAASADRYTVSGIAGADKRLEAALARWSSFELGAAASYFGDVDGSIEARLFIDKSSPTGAVLAVVTTAYRDGRPSALPGDVVTTEYAVTIAPAVAVNRGTDLTGDVPKPFPDCPAPWICPYN